MIPPLVLASASPRRTALLHMLGLEHEVLPADVDERYRKGESPARHVERLAREKAWAVAARRPGALVLGADTDVVLRDEVLGKPADEAGAAAMLLRLAGRTHTVYTALALVEPGGKVDSLVDRAEVSFRVFGRADAERYAATGEPADKAGAYGIQGRGAALVSRIEGDYYTVVGMPVMGLLDLLGRAGWHYAFGDLARAPHGEMESRAPHPSSTFALEP